MKTTQGNMLASLRNVQGFLQTNAATLASGVDAAITQRLDAAIVTLTGHATDQVQKFIQAKGSTQTQEGLRSELLKFYIAPINRIARLELGNTPELTPFLMPKGRQSIEKLKSFADGMAAAAANYSATFIAAGLPTDFIAQLNAVSTAMVQATSSRAQTTAQRKGATTSLRSMLTLGRKIVHVLDPLVQKVIHNDPGLLSIWNTVKRVPRTGSTAAPTTPAPATAATATAPTTAPAPVTATATATAAAAPTTAPVTPAATEHAASPTT